MKKGMRTIIAWACILASLVLIGGAQAQEASSAVKSVLFVDRGNIQRSVVAELILQKMLKARNLGTEYKVVSRGLQGTPASPVLPAHNNLKYYNKSTSAGMEWENSLPTLQELGIAEEFEKHAATVLTKDDLEKATLVLSMDSLTLTDPTWGIAAQFPAYSAKAMLFTELVGSSAGISDGYGATDSNRHRQLILDINKTLQQGFEQLMRRLNK